MMRWLPMTLVTTPKVAGEVMVVPGVAIVGTFPEGSHPPIIYPIAILSDSNSPGAAAYLDYLKSGKAARFFTDQGFTILK